GPCGWPRPGRPSPRRRAAGRWPLAPPPPRAGQPARTQPRPPAAGPPPTCRSRRSTSLFGHQGSHRPFAPYGRAPSRPLGRTGRRDDPLGDQLVDRPGGADRRDLGHRPTAVGDDQLVTLADRRQVLAEMVLQLPNAHLHASLLVATFSRPV